MSPSHEIVTRVSLQYGRATPATPYTPAKVEEEGLPLASATHSILPPTVLITSTLLLCEGGGELEAEDGLFPDERRSTADGGGSGLVVAMLSAGVKMGGRLHKRRKWNRSQISDQEAIRDFAVLIFVAQTTRRRSHRGIPKVILDESAA